MTSAIIIVCTAAIEITCKGASHEDARTIATTTR